MPAPRLSSWPPGILNVWMHDAMWVASRHAQLTQAYPDRFLLGLGVSHAVLVDNAEDGHRYARPLSAMIGYLDLLDAAAPPVPTSERALAALGPKMLELARDRALGAHPYLVTTDHTAHAREILGPGPLLAPELKVVLSTDATEARSISRQGLALYLTLPNYTDNLQRIGFTAADLANGGSDRLVDSIVAWGDLDAIAHRIRQHREAGADHVCLQVLTANDSAFPLAQWRELASMLPAIS